MMKKNTFLTLMLLITALVNAQNIELTFANAENTNDGTDDFYEADILISAIDSQADFKLGSGQLYINYNTAAFGTNVSAGGNIEYTQPDGYILGATVGAPPFQVTVYKDFIQNDNTSSIVSLSFQQGVSSGSIPSNNVTSTPALLFHIKIKYADFTQDPMIGFELGISAAADQFFTACGPNTGGFPDCTNEPGTQFVGASFDDSGATIIVDNTAPVISLTGNATVTVEAGTTYSDAGATATDDIDGDITGDIVTVNPVDTSIPGVYTVTYNVSDAAGNAATEVTREVIVSDTTIPVITLNGSDIVLVEAGTTYTDAGATAFDSFDGDITADIVVVNDVETNALGIYNVTYNVSDAAGNGADEITREVTVEDTTPPVITLEGAATVTVEVGATYSDEGATASDSFDADLTGDIVVVNNVETNAPGVYTVTYNVSDGSGNAATEVTREVTVSDTTVPVITLSGSATVTIEAGTTYTDAGATASDSFDGDITSDIVVVNPVNTSIPGVYTITYNVSDSSLNAAAEVTREVTVSDTTVPVITLSGSATVTVEAATMYTDAGATASDSLDGDITAAIVVVNPLGPTIPGVYTITYNVSDAAGNAAVEVTREVTVVDTTVPVITLSGSATVTVEAGTTYTDDGATANDSLDGDITAAIVVVNPVDASVPGVYTVTYNVSDGTGNAATEVTREVTVSDTTVPVITLVGDNPVEVAQGAAYTDAGATAADSLDGDITAAIVVVNPVDTFVEGTYTITYNVMDAAGNVATEVTRTVNVSPLLGIEDNQIDGLSIYPNPTEGKLFISLEVTEVKIYTITGQQVLRSVNNELDMSDLASGVYFAHIFTDKGNAVKRILKE